MTSIYETTDRLIGEHVDALLALAWEADNRLQPASADTDERSHQPTMPFVRLVGAVRLLYELHCVDTKGRCRICTTRAWWWRTRVRPCTVYAALSFYLTQPDELVLHEIPRPPTMPDADQTLELPRIRDS